MKRIFLYFVLFFLWPLALAAQKVVSINIDASINPATADFIHRTIQKTAREKAQCLVIRLNTPGGLLESTRNIVSDILESPVPVVVYVSPGGAHAGSAGVFITLAAHIAAMAPGTNLGAAHPVVLQGNVDSTMNTKMTNDAAAFIRSIAVKRQRNIGWAEEAVRKSLSITEKEALDSNVINLVADNTRDLLNRIDGRQVTVSTGVVTLHTRGAVIEPVEMGMMEKILNILSDPNVAYILMLLGMYGLMFELYNPGLIFPGIVGVISLILAFYAMHTLPVNYAGVALIVFAIILFLLEIKIASHGLLAIGGIVSLVLGSMMFIRTSPTGQFVQLSYTVMITSVAVTSFFFLFVVGLGLKAQRARPVTGLEAMIGETGLSMEFLNPAGTVRVHGEIWRAVSVSGDIPKGAKVRVVAIQHFTVQVEQVI